MLFAIEGRVGQRKLWGIVTWPGATRRQMVDTACAQPWSKGCTATATSRPHRTAGGDGAMAALQAAPDSRRPPTLTQQTHELIRSADEYGDLFAHAAATAPHRRHQQPPESSAMNMIEIERALRELRLSGIAETLSTRVMQAQAAQEPFLETFAAMLQDELDRRRSRLMERRFKRSGLDERLSLADFDWRFNPKLPRSACFELHTLKFIGEGANALIIGKPGTGKSHVAKAVAYQATLQGYDVRLPGGRHRVRPLRAGQRGERAELLKDWVEPDLLVLDDLFLARRISEHAAELLQAIVHQRYKLRRAIVITSNRVVQDWGKYLGDATMATTILDRLMHRCAMLEFEGKSYRLKEAAARIAVTPESS
jgi:DNA replication protein DnaC